MGKPKILIVDDEPDVVAFIERTLVTENMEVLVAYDGIGALDVAEREQPDLVLLDIMMPMMSGYEVCEQIKANPLTQHIPVVCVTSAQTPDSRSRSRAAGAATVIMKPFLIAELIAQVRRHLPAKEEAEE